MSIYTMLIAAIAGICLGYAILYLFIGLRRLQDQRLNLLFVLFALGYAGTLLLGIAYRSQTAVSDFLALNRWDGVFLWLAFVALNWYVAEYTDIKPKPYLRGITAVFSVAILAAMLTPTLTFAETPTLVSIPLPWNEEITALGGEENIWGVLLLLAQLVTLGFIVFAGLRQWRRGERLAAIVLLGGMSWFIIALLYEILAEAGLWAFIPFAETGFIGIAIALSLQMANRAIETEEALTRHQDELETLVDERTADLQEANQRLLRQERIAAATEERNRIARDLHDAVTQTVYSASLIAEVLPQVWERSPDEGRRNLVKLRQLVRGALAEMRTLLFELRPASLEAANLTTLLQQLADVLTGQTRIPVTLHVEGEPQPPATVKVAFYRIAQEAFNNVAKHARATQVAATLQGDGTCVEMVIRDNGRGFDVASAPPDRMGLRIMRERAQEIGAALTLTSAPAQGTEINMTWNSAEVSSNNE